MNKAFIFDMDGVLIDSERTWAKYGDPFLIELFGQEIVGQLGSLLGLKLDAIYDRAVSFGFVMDKKAYYEAFDAQAKKIYELASVTEGLDELVNELLKNKFKIGLVTASRTVWINIVLTRLSFGDKFEYIISINDRPELQPKPHPEGYLEAMRELGASPKTTLILEDSNTGIASAKASGATVIGFKANLIEGYNQKGADVYVENTKEVIKIVKSFKG